MESCFLNVLNGKKSERIPTWFMRQAGRSLPEYRKYSEAFPDLMKKFLCPEAICELTLQPLRRFDIDAAIIFSDILMIPYALGQKVSFIEHQGPLLGDFKLNELSLDHFDQKVEPVLEGITMTTSRLSKEKALIGFVGAPWTLATYMIGKKSLKNFNEIIQFSITHENEFNKLIELLTTACIRFMEKQIEAGVMALQIFDSWAGAVPDFMIDKCITQPLLEISTHLKKNYPHIPLISFPKGIGYQIDQLIENQHVDAFSFDSTMPTPEILRIQSKKITQGHLDPNILWAGGEKLDEGVRHILKELCAHSRHIFNLGHGVLPTTPLNHIERTIQLIRS